MFTGKVLARFFIITIGVLSLAQLILCSVVRTSTSNTKVGSTTDFNKNNEHFKNEVTNEEDTGDITSSEEIKETAVDKFATELENFIFKELNVFSNKSLRSLKEIIENVIQDVATYEGVNKEKIEAEIEPLKKFTSKLQQLIEKEEDDIRDDLINKFNLLTTIAETLNAFNTTLIKKPSYEVIFVEKLLKKHYIEILVSELDQSAERFKKHFRSNAQEIWQKLPADERGSNKIFEQWLENFEKDSDLLKFFNTFFNWHKLDVIVINN